MKKIFSLLLVATIASAFVGCSGEKDSTISGPRIENAPKLPTDSGSNSGSSDTKKPIEKVCDDYEYMDEEAGYSIYYCDDDEAFYLCDSSSCDEYDF